MDNKRFKIAVASSDGIVVNRHFGRADTFYIYDVSENGSDVRLSDIRHVNPVCHGGEHDEADILFNVSQLGDCTHVLVEKIGQMAAYALERQGVSPMELPGIITESIQRLVSYEQVQALFDK